MIYAVIVALLLTAVRGQEGCENKDYKSQIGLDFQISCESNIDGNDINNSTASSLEACIDACAVAIPGGYSACRAVSYKPDTKRCYKKDGNSTSSDLVYKNDTITAIADAAPFQPNPASSPCPDGNGTIHTDDNGMEYIVICGTYWGGNAYDPGKTGESAYAPFHADTLDECMSYCSANAPLCYGVRWEESSTDYYRNCWPKKQNSTHSSSELKADEFAVAAVGRLQVNSTCTGSSKMYTASNQATLKQSCDSSADGPDIEVVHAPNYEECMDKCATYTSSDDGNTQCRGIAYQPSAEQGFRNCYLKYALSNVTSKASWHTATLETRGDGIGEESSKAWIAGAVAGPVIGLAAIAGLVFWYRRRRKAGSSPNRPDDYSLATASDKEPFNTTTSYYDRQTSEDWQKSSSIARPPPPPFNAHPQTVPFAEMPQTSRGAHELPGRGSVRYELQS